MTKTLDYYTGGAQEFARKMTKELSVPDIGIIKYVCFVFGLLCATWFPNFAKKCRALLTVIGILLMIPLVLKAVRVFHEVFGRKNRRW